MPKLRTMTLLTLLFTAILSISVHDCPAQERRQLLGGEKWVWDPVGRQWVYHQGTTTIKANRGSNALPKRGYLDIRQQLSNSTSASAKPSSPRQKMWEGKHTCGMRTVTPTMPKNQLSTRFAEWFQILIDAINDPRNPACVFHPVS